VIKTQSGQPIEMRVTKMNAASAKEYPLLHKTILRDGIKVSDQNHSSVTNVGCNGFLNRLAYL